MVHAEVNFTIERGDYRRYFQRLFGGSRAARVGRVVTYVFIELVLIALIVTMYLQTGSFPIWMGVIAASPLLIWLIPRGTERFVRRVGGKSKDLAWSRPTPMTVRLTDEGYEVVSSISTINTPWQSITHVDEDTWGVYFEPAAIARFVPKRAFVSTVEAQRFVEMARKLIRDSASRMPTPYIAQSTVVSIRFVWDESNVEDLMKSMGATIPVVSRWTGVQKTGRGVAIAIDVAVFLFIAWQAGPTVLAMFQNPGGRPTGATYFVLPAYGMMLIVMIAARFFPKGMATWCLPKAVTAREPHTIRIDERGVVSETQGAVTIHPWNDVEAVDVGDRVVRFMNDAKPTSIPIPRYAFSTEDELTYFVDIAKAYIDSARSGNPPTFPTPASWPPPPNG